MSTSSNSGAEDNGKRKRPSKCCVCIGCEHWGLCGSFSLVFFMLPFGCVRICLFLHGPDIPPSVYRFYRLQPFWHFLDLGCFNTPDRSSPFLLISPWQGPSRVLLPSCPSSSPNSTCLLHPAIRTQSGSLSFCRMQAWKRIGRRTAGATAERRNTRFSIATNISAWCGRWTAISAMPVPTSPIRCVLLQSTVVTIDQRSNRCSASLPCLTLLSIKPDFSRYTSTLRRGFSSRSAPLCEFLVHSNDSQGWWYNYFIGCRFDPPIRKKNFSKSLKTPSPTIYPPIAERLRWVLKRQSFASTNTLVLSVPRRVSVCLSGLWPRDGMILQTNSKTTRLPLAITAWVPVLPVANSVTPLKTFGGLFNSRQRRSYTNRNLVLDCYVCLLCLSGFCIHLDSGIDYYVWEVRSIISIGRDKKRPY